MDFAKSMIFALSILAFTWWIASIVQAKGEDKLTEACFPIEFTGTKIQQLSTSLVGYTPNWTFSFRRVMESGCYYFFTILFTPPEGDAGAVNGNLMVEEGGYITDPNAAPVILVDPADVQ